MFLIRQFYALQSIQVPCKLAGITLNKFASFLVIFSYSSVKLFLLLLLLNK